MIHYQLRCSREHEFDGWFKDSAAFDRQVARALVECPTCGDTKVGRALMAPALGRRAAHPAEAASLPVQDRPVDAAATVPSAAPRDPRGALAGRIPDHVRAMLQKLRSEVERNCDYVGPRFAEEARRIQAGESPQRGIYGETTPDQAESLAEDGISFSRIPWVPRADG
ncbi:MAG: DUF1178 family protein [Rhodospirillales bacterium]|jgi:hypothetical protein|nr:DUF1178 family protein [Rhodospirillales bacterium]